MEEVLTYRDIRKIDPTHTTGLRNAFSRDMKRRFSELALMVYKAVAKEDVFGLKPKTHTMQMTTPGTEKFAYMTSAEKVESFMAWLQEQVDKGILDVRQFQQIGFAVNQAWTNMYIYDSYKRGVIRARYEMIKGGMKIPSIEASGGIDVNMLNFFHIDRVGLLFTRTYNDLKGITAAMDMQISRVLAQGMADGDGMLMIARKLVATINGTGVDKLGITDTLGRFIPATRRAEMLARTEILRAYAESTLQEFKNWGLEGVTAMAEFTTAGDDRVCFPEFIKVATNKGDKNINKIKKGDKVLTPNGIEEVIDIMERNYIGDMVALHFENDFLFCTSEHPIWSVDRNQWIFAKDIRLYEFVQSIGNTKIQVLGIVNFGFSKMDNIPFIFIKGNISLFVFNRIMPKQTIDFNSNFKLGQGEVYQISSNFMFLNITQMQSIEGKSHFCLDGSFTFGGSVATSTTKDNLTQRSFAKIFTTIGTCFKDWWSSAYFRTKMSINSSFNIFTFMQKWFSTSFTQFCSTVTMLFLALKRTIIIPISNRCFNSKFFSTSNTNFFSKISSESFIAITRAKMSTICRWYKHFTTLCAVTWRNCFSIFCITFVRTKSMTQFWVIICSSMKRFITMITDKCIYFSFRFRRTFNRTKLTFSGSSLELFSTMITGNYRHKSFDVFNSASKYTKKKLKVYDITVKKEHCFYANKILVHNCPKCEHLEGNVYSLDEASGIIPVHPQCRCCWLPYIEDIQKYR
jgi:hypothetical protein